MDGSSTEHAVWVWGLSLIGLTLIIHALGIVLLALPGLKLRIWLGGRNFRLRSAIPIVVGFIAIIGIMLAVLHGLYAAIWAAAYWRFGALASFEDALFRSVDSMATRGAAGVPLGQNLQMLGALEAVDGMLLFGFSTAFVFAALHAYWPLLANAVGSDPES
jgi:hypothetical protein